MTFADLRGDVLAAIAGGDGPQSVFIADDPWHVGPKGQALLARLLAGELTRPTASQ